MRLRAFESGRDRSRSLEIRREPSRAIESHREPSRAVQSRRESPRSVEMARSSSIARSTWKRIGRLSLAAITRRPMPRPSPYRFRSDLMTPLGGRFDQSDSAHSRVAPPLTQRPPRPPPFNPSPIDTPRRLRPRSTSIVTEPIRRSIHLSSYRFL